MTMWNGCFVIPTYDNPLTIRGVVESARKSGMPVIVVDDGSAEPGRLACEALTADGLAIVVRHAVNRGKGAAVKTGFRVALENGFTHALQVDGDAQHDLSHVPQFVQTSKAAPTALLLGYPVYDDSVPRVRLLARQITTFWVNLEVGFGRIRDAMIGFRIYPLTTASALTVPSDGMDFDIEIAVRAAWAGLPLVNLPVRLRYLSEAEGGVTHFKVWRDTWRFFRLHSRLCTLRCMRLVLPNRPALPAGNGR